MARRGALTTAEVKMARALMQLSPMRESEVMAIRRELTETAERLQRRADQLPNLIASVRQRLVDLEAEQRDVATRLHALVGDEERGVLGLVQVLNEQLNLFHPEASAPSASLGRRGHAAPLRAVPVARGTAEVPGG
jgi:hypothetical protein